MSDCPYEADCDATAELCRTLRQEIERLTAANTRFGQRLIETEQRVAELEQAVRLHLAVAPDDPVLITPVEQQLVAMRQERNEAHSQRDFAKEDRDLYYQRWEAVSKERDSWQQEAKSVNKVALDLTQTLARVEGELAALKSGPTISLIDDLVRIEWPPDASCAVVSRPLIEHWMASENAWRHRLAQAEQREARLRDVLKAVLDPDGYLDSIIIAIYAAGQRYYRPAIPIDVCEQAQQALSLSTDQSPPTGPDKDNPAS